jgi:hypothetical protein
MPDVDAAIPATDATAFFSAELSAIVPVLQRPVVVAVCPADETAFQATHRTAVYTADVAAQRAAFWLPYRPAVRSAFMPAVDAAIPATHFSYF